MKFLNKLQIIMLGMSLLVNANIALAEIVSIDAEGVYTIGDGPDESIVVAKERAKNNAMKNATEKAGVYIESLTKINNGYVTQDDISILASKILKITEQPKFFTEINNDTITYRCRIKAEIDTEAVELAHIYDKKNSIDNLKKIQEKAVELEEEVTLLKEEKKKAQAIVLMDKGMEEMLKGNYSQAVVIFTEAISKYSISGAYGGRGLLYLELKEYENAIADFNKEIELDKKDCFTDFSPYEGKGQAYFGLKQYENALENYNKSIQIFPMNQYVYDERGLVYFELKQYDNAISDFTKAILLAPDYFEAYNNRGVAYFELKQYDNAISDFNNAISFNPNYSVAYNNRGETYFKLKEYDKAMSDCTQAIELDPMYIEAYKNRGKIYTELNQYNDAIADFDKALEIDSSSEDIRKLKILANTKIHN